MKELITVAGIQIFCDRTKQKMLEKAECYMQKAYEMNPNIDLFVLPEQFYQLEQNDYGESYGEEPEGDFEEWLKKCARQFHANIVGGSYPVRITVINEKANEKQDKICNRCLVADRMGNIVGYYDKIHLFDAFGKKESDTFDAGNELGLFDLDIGKVGVWICYDTRFPEISRALSRKGADILCVPAAFYRPNSDQWEVLLKAAAIYNVLPLVAVNQYGMIDSSSGFFGRSMFIDPKGIITAGISDQEGYFIGQVDMQYTAQCRNANPEMQNRRYDLYKEWF